MWVTGMINDYLYQVKYYEKGSRYGINKGRDSKLWICKNGTELYNYDRGLDFDNLDSEGKEVYELILK